MENQKKWWQEAVIYEVYADKFANNFSGFTDRLPYLKNLGINCIWLLPHFPSDLIDDGYDVSDYFDIRKELGTQEDFENFVRAAHAHSIRIITDLVLNHTSIKHPWFIDARRSVHSPYRDFYFWSETKDKFSAAANPLQHLKASNWIFNPQTGDYYFASFYPEQADLNWDNPAVPEFISKVTDFWMERGVDGFRLDAVPFIVKREGTDCTNQPEVHEILRNLRKHIIRKNPDVILIAEANGTPAQIAQYFGNGDECQLAFHFPLIFFLYHSLKENDPRIAQAALKDTLNIPDTCAWISFLNNHDDISFRFNFSEERGTLLSFLDPEGKYTSKKNKTVAVRLATAFGKDEQMIKKAFDLLLNLPAVPAIYYGEEIGMKNLNFEEPLFDMRRYTRGPFDWVLAQQVVTNPDSLYHFIRQKIQQRKPNREDFQSEQ